MNVVQFPIKGVGRFGLAAAVCFMAAGFDSAVANPKGLDPQKEIAPFVAEVSREFGLDAKRVTAVMEDARVLDNVLKAMSRPAERKAWKDYRKIFMTRERIDAGVAFAAEAMVA